MGEPHSTVSSPLSDQQCAHEGRNETCTEKQLRERTQRARCYRNSLNFSGFSGKALETQISI